MPRKRIIINGRNEYDGGSSHYCFDFDCEFNRRGNIEVFVKSVPSSFVSYFPIPIRYVFCRRSGVCISHPPSKRYRHHKVNARLGDSFT